MTMGRYDTKTLSPQVASELATLGLPPGKLIQLLHTHTVERATEMGIKVRIPYCEPFRVYMENAKRPTGRRQGLSNASYETYGRILAQFYAFSTGQKYVPTNWRAFPITEDEFDGRRLMSDIRPFLETTSEVRGLTDRTYNKYVAALRTFIREIRDLYDLPKAPLPRLVRLNQPLPLALRDSDVRTLLHIARSSNYGVRAHFLITFLLAAGLRRNEFVNVRLRDVDFDNPSVYVVGKGGQPRIVPLPKTVMPIMLEYIDVYNIHRPTDYLYSKINNPVEKIRGETLDRQALRMFRKLDSYDATDPIHAYCLHSLRHTYATKLLRKGVTLRSISQALGHSSVETTKIYTVLDVDGLREQLSPALDVMSDWWKGALS